jgi:hypothetical protein
MEERVMSVVLRKMLDIIPAEEEELREELDRLYETVCFIEKRQEGVVTPPPDMKGMWTLAAGSLETHLSGKPPARWLRDISALFNGRGPK